MNNPLKKHQKVRLLRAPNPEYLEYHLEDLGDNLEDEKPIIKSGALAKINIVMQNGQYHVEILNDKEQIIAYALVNEEDIEPI